MLLFFKKRTSLSALNHILFPQVSITSCNEIVPVFNNGAALCLGGSGTILLNELSNGSKQTLFLSLLHCNFVISRASIRTVKYQRTRMLSMPNTPPAGTSYFLVSPTSSVWCWQCWLLSLAEFLRAGWVPFSQPEPCLNAWKCGKTWGIFAWQCRLYRLPTTSAISKAAQTDSVLNS